MTKEEELKEEIKSKWKIVIKDFDKLKWSLYEIDKEINRITK